MSLDLLAGHILAVANNEGSGVTNLQLQKVLFFTMGTALRRGKPQDIQYFIENYNNDFEKWRYGPVIPSLYFRYNRFGDQPIDDLGNYHEAFSEYDDIIKKFINVNVYRLVAISHKMDAWKDCKSEILSGLPVEPYTFDEIFRDFTKKE